MRSFSVKVQEQQQSFMSKLEKRLNNCLSPSKRERLMALELACEGCYSELTEAAEELDKLNMPDTKDESEDNVGLGYFGTPTHYMRG